MVDIIKTFFNNLFDKAFEKVGLPTIFISMFTFGISSFFLDIFHSTFLSISIFSIVGLFEFIKINSKSNIDKRRNPIHERHELYYTIMLKKGLEEPLIVDEFNYNGFLFRTLGFDEIPVALTVAGPLCPRCKSILVETIKFIFPCHYNIIFYCICGFSKKSNKTESEMIFDLFEFKNIPRDIDNKYM